MSESSSEIGASSPLPVEGSRKLPKVRYAPYFNSAECPYDVEVDVEKYADRLKDMGLSDRQIGRLNIHVARRQVNPFGKALGVYLPHTNTIKIFPEAFWDNYRRFRRIVDKAIKGGGEKDVKKSLDEVKSGMRLANSDRFYKYVTNSDIPEERKRNFVEHLLERTKFPDVRMSKFLIHESKHKSENPLIYIGVNYLLRLAAVRSEALFRKGVELGIGYITSSDFSFGNWTQFVDILFITNFLALAYDFSPLENRAIKAEQLYHKDPDSWRVVTIRPKEPDEKSSMLFYPGNK